MEINWLSNELKNKVRKVFKPDYKRQLLNEEIIVIANNLTDFMEAYIKFKLRQKNENRISKP